MMPDLYFLPTELLCPSHTSEAFCALWGCACSLGMIPWAWRALLWSTDSSNLIFTAPGCRCLSSHCTCFSHSRFPSFSLQDYTAASHALCSEPFPAFWTVTQWWNFLGTEMALLMVLHHGRENTGINWVWLKCSQFQLGWQSYVVSALFICSCFNANTRVNSNVDMMKERSFMHLQGFSKKLCVLELNKVQQFSIKWQNEWLYFSCCISSIR